MTGLTTRREEALFWVDIYRELLAVDESALVRMRKLLASALATGRHEIDQLEDVDLVLREVDRVNRRLAYWHEQIRGLSA